MIDQRLKGADSTAESNFTVLALLALTMTNC